MKSVSILLLSLLIGTASVLAADPVFIDFGASNQRTESKFWNNVDDQNQSSVAGIDLVDSAAKPSGIRLFVVSPFSGPNQSGTREEMLSYPETAIADSLFANVEKFHQSENVTPVLKLTGLKPGAKYVFTFFASRMGSGDNRTARYTAVGANTEFTELDAANNREATAVTKPIAPAQDGSVTITIAAASSNTNSNHFTYLGVLQISLAE